VPAPRPEEIIRGKLNWNSAEYYLKDRLRLIRLART
jgi:hypothetical protein